MGLSSLKRQMGQALLLPRQSPAQSHTARQSICLTASLPYLLAPLQHFLPTAPTVPLHDVAADHTQEVPYCRRCPIPVSQRPTILFRWFSALTVVASPQAFHL